MNARVLVLLSGVLLACSAGNSKDGPTSHLGGDTGTQSGDDGGGIHVDDASSTFDVSGDTPMSDECSEENKQIYVVSQENELHRFAPATLTLTKIGALDCPSSATPFSMAVDRKGTAWVLYDDGHIFHVSTKDASCTSTTFATDQAGFHTFGMGFVADTAGSSAETLYVADYSGKGLGKIDTSTLNLSFVGDYGDALGAAELTGTGTARLFAFFNQVPVDVAELNKSTGKVLKLKAVSGVTVGSGWAFAHWGGDFWLFTAPSGSSQITKYSFDTGTSTVVKSDLGFVIVGAGVSTCAPTAPPK